MSDDADSEQPESTRSVVKKKEKTGASAVIVREMELEDLSAVFALGERLFTADLWPTLYRTWDEYELVQTFASDSETCLVAEFEGKVAGFALGTLLDKRRSAWTYGYLVWLGVDSALGRQGIGKKLVNRLTEIFIEQGARMMLVDTEADNVGAVTFFHRHGFGNDTKHVYMSKNLTHHPEYVRRKRLAAATHVSKHTARQTSEGDLEIDIAKKTPKVKKVEGKVKKEKVKKEKIPKADKISAPKPLKVSVTPGKKDETP